MNVRTTVAAWCLAFSLLGCAHRGGGADAVPTEPTLEASDWREVFRGTWEVRFRLDSTRSLNGGWVKATGAEAVGRLVVTDTLAGQSGTLKSRLEIDFQSLLGRPMSCFTGTGDQLGISESGGGYFLNFTPNAADCGFGASVGTGPDRFTGEWGEQSFSGPVVAGRFSMSREH
jgi:hypothetical protein